MAVSKNNLKPAAAKKFAVKMVERFFIPLVVLLLAASIFSFYFIFGRTYRDFRSGKVADSANTAVMQMAIRDNQQRLQVLQSHAAELKAIPEEDGKRMSIVLPDGPNQLETLIQLEAFIRSLKLPLDAFNFTVGAQAAAKNAAPDAGASGDAELISSLTAADRITITVNEAEYDNLKKIISAIERNLRLLDIESLNFEAESGEVNMSITTRHLPQ